MNGETKQSPPSTPPAPASGVILWVFSLLAGLFFLGMAAFKLTNHAPTVAAFEAWGYGLTFLHAMGWLEAAGGVALMVPRLTTWAAAILSLEMVGEIYSIVTTGLGILPLPIICLVVLALIGFHRRHRALGAGAG